MLSLVNSFQMPGKLNHITVYPDSSDPFCFHYFNNTPRVSVDSEGNPFLSCSIIARNAEIAKKKLENGEYDTSKVQLGILNFTVDLGLTQEEYDGVVKEVKKILLSEGYRKCMAEFYPDHYHEIINTDSPNIVLTGVGGARTGSVKLKFLENMGEGFTLKSDPEEVTPALDGDFRASFYIGLGQEGSQLVYRLLGARREEESNSLQAVVEYQLNDVIAHIPPVAAKIEVDMADTHTKFMKSILDDKMLWGYTDDMINTGGGVNGSFRNGVYIYNGTAYISECACEEMMHEFLRNSGSVKVTFSQDFSVLRGEKGSELEKKILDSILDIVTNSIMPKLFEKVDSKEMLDEVPNLENMINQEVKKREETVASMQLYKFSKNSSLRSERNFTFEFKCSNSVTHKFPCSSTLYFPEAKESGKSLVKILDIGQPLLDVLSIPVSVSANFEENKIMEIDVEVKYEHEDYETKALRRNHKTYIFKPGERTPQRFFVTMARDKDGKPIESYEIKSRVVYAERDIPKENNGWSSYKTMTEKAITLSFGELGYINVSCYPRNIDWDVIEELYVNFEYPAAYGKPDTKCDVIFKKDGPAKQTWNCYKYGNNKDEYRYKIKYINKDGTEYSTDWFRSTSKQLPIDDCISGTQNILFEARVNKDIESVKVDVKYEDSRLGVNDYQTHLFTSNDSWECKLKPVEGGEKSFYYKYTITYKDGETIENSPWVGPITFGQEIDVIEGKFRTSDIDVFCTIPDLDQWALLYVNFECDDNNKGILIDKKIKMKLIDDQSVSILLPKDEETKVYYSYTLISKSGKKVKVENQLLDEMVVLIKLPE